MHKEHPLQKPPVCVALLLFPMALILSCGIPTSMPILPKTVTVKANPSVSVPLGGVNYNLYSGLSGGNLQEGLGSLEDIAGPSWLDELPEGIAIYDYRPAGEGEDNTQKFLLHYSLDMGGTLGQSGEFDLGEYKDMLKDLTGEPTPINDVSFEIPSMKVEEQFDVQISLDVVADQIAGNTDDLKGSTAYLPVQKGARNYAFPDDIMNLDDRNKGQDFSVTLKGMDSLTFQEGTMNFNFTLRYGPSLAQGSTLRLSNFKLRAAATGKTVQNVDDGNRSVTLDFPGATGSLSLQFTNAELPQKFYLVCDLEITGSGTGFFELDIKPVFEDFTISGAGGLELTPAQIASLADNFDKTSPIRGGLGESFNALVDTGNLYVDTGELFPPLDPSRPDAEGWNLALDLSELYVQQEPVIQTPPLSDARGLSLGGPGQSLRSGDNDLYGETLNYNDVHIKGKVSVSMPGNKLTFRNFPGGIKKGAPGTYEKTVTVTMDVSLFREVKVLAEDFGLEEVNQEITQELGEDFSSFKGWINYIQFPEWSGNDPERGLGLVLDIGHLHLADGLGLYINSPELGLDYAFQPLENDPASDGARLIFINKDSGGYKLMGADLPEELFITVELGLEDPAAQQIYRDTGILTLKNVVPGDTMTVSDAVARLVFDWAEISIKPQPHVDQGEDDSLPTYPFEGAFPDAENGEEGIDLSALSKGLGFYIPEDGAGEGPAAHLYISLKRKILNENGDWVEDPKSPDYDEDDPDGWRSNMQVNLPNLDFRIRYGDGSHRSDNLFTYEPRAQNDTGSWALSRSIADILAAMEDQNLITGDAENKDNPFKIYAAPSLPEPDKAIPLGNLAKALNETLTGRQEGPLFFEYTIELADIPGEEAGKEEPGEILLYPDMLNKKVVVSLDILMLFPMVLQADPGAEGPLILSLGPDLGEEDLFRRAGPDDNEYFDRITSFGFSVVTKNVAGLRAGKLFLENETDVKKLKYRLPIVDFTNPRSDLSLDAGELEKIQAIWPFIPRMLLEFERGDVLRFERNFNIELRSITVKAGGEYTFETGL
jgi:hypothetical protein